MPAQKIQLPFDRDEVYGTHPIRSERYVLKTELDEEPNPDEGKSARVRLLTDFLFTKNGKLVFPDHQSCTKEFWADVEVWGFMMAPTGVYRWLAWSLLWHLDWPGKHMELVRINKILGMSKEKNEHFRNGNQVALWLNSARGFAYALMEPETQIAERWKQVLESWRLVGKGNLSVPFCTPVDTVDAVPEWWNERGKPAGKIAWQKLVEQRAHLANLETEPDEDPTPAQQTAESKGEEKSETPAKGKPGKPAARATSAPAQPCQPRQVDEAAGSPRASTPQPTAPPARSTPTLAKKGTKRPADNVQPDSGGQDAPAGTQSEAPLPLSEDDSRAAGASPSKRTRVMSPQEFADEMETPAEGKPISRDQAPDQPEPVSSPGPCTREVDTMPPPATDGQDLDPTFSKGSSPSNEPDFPAASQGSQLARDVRELSLTHNGHEGSIEAMATEAHATTEGAPEGVDSTSTPGAAPVDQSEVDQAEASGAGSPNAAPSPVDSAMSISDAEASTPTPTVAVSTAPAPVRHGSRVPQEPALPTEPPVEPVAGSETGHEVLPVPGLEKDGAASLDSRSSRRHKSGVPRGSPV